MKCFIQILLHLSQLISGGAEPSVVEVRGGLLPGYLNSIQFYLYWAKCHDTFHVGQVYTIHPFWSRSQLSLGEASLDRTLYNNNPHRDLFISDTLHGSGKVQCFSIIMQDAKCELFAASVFCHCIKYFFIRNYRKKPFALRYCETKLKSSSFENDLWRYIEAFSIFWTFCFVSVLQSAK